MRAAFGRRALHRFGEANDGRQPIGGGETSDRLHRLDEALPEAAARQALQGFEPLAKLGPHQHRRIMFGSHVGPPAVPDARIMTTSSYHPVTEPLPPEAGRNT